MKKCVNNNKSKFAEKDQKGWEISENLYTYPQ